MNHTITTPENFLAQTAPFDRLSTKTQSKLAQSSQYYRYHIGQPIALNDRLSAQINIIVEGTVRLLGYPGGGASPITLDLLTTGNIIGAIGVMRGVPCESAIASTEVTCLAISTELFIQIVLKEPILRSYFEDRPSLLEVFELLRLELAQYPNPDQLLQLLGANSLKDLAVTAFNSAIVYPSPQQIPASLKHWHWFIGSQPLNPAQSTDSQRIDAIGDRLDLDSFQGNRQVRSIGIAPQILEYVEQVEIDRIIDIDDAMEMPPSSDLSVSDPPAIPYAPALPLTLNLPTKSPQNYQLVRGKGQIDASVACFEMLAHQFKMPFRRDSVRKVIAHHVEQSGGISLQFCGAVADFLGLQGQLATVPIVDLQRIQVPALIKWQDGLAVICAVAHNSVTIALPDSGLIKRSPQELLVNQTTDRSTDQDFISLLLIQATRYTPAKKFGISWFWPSIVKYKIVLIEVLIASFFIQLFGLANPLITQVIIDKVLMQNSPNALNVFGVLLIGIAIGEALLTSLRTYLFVDTTNRIDLTLGAQIIDRLLRLPLRYFEKRSVGELSTRVGELENIRQFLNLDSVSLEFPAGKFIGIVGQSGSGKSTLMKLLPRLYPLESGRILVDDYDISKVELYSLRQQIGIVPQDTLLFEGSVQENIALNYPDASTDQIIRAAKIAFAHEFIMDLPNGYNSPVGERGAGLSGGQRQRIAIARTILQNPRLLILDEATSALDYDSEHQVCTNIAAAFERKTVFFITHRLTTIRNADIILMMDRGLVAEVGSHQELMALKGRYYCLYQQQETQVS
jgi:ABC-type bacteriocin/lantibiotic exporter with double-glycine peptidase domain